jgi:3-oxoacyl-[acyl-carrier-protein] synthase-1
VSERSSVLAITGLGMRSSIGQNAIQTAAAVRAGICRFAEWPSPPADSKEKGGVAMMGAAVVPDLGSLNWMDKLDDLVTQPLMEALWMSEHAELLEEGQPTPWAVYLATPALNRVGTDEEAAASFAEDVKEGMLLSVNVPELHVVPGGNAAVMVALQQAMASLIQGRVSVCVVGGVDSLLHLPFLEHLDTEARLKTEATPVGLIPGEAAGFVVIERGPPSRTSPARRLANFTEPRLTIERESPDGKNPSRGRAAAQALRMTLADSPIPPQRIQRVIADMNGERWRFLEWALASNPALVALPPDWRLWTPADCFGDVGAATGAMHLCLATRAFERDYAVGDGIIVFNASETGERGALCVYPPEPA